MSSSNDLWVFILEKAWAKLHGCYERIINGQVHKTLRDLTGAPSWEVNSKDDWNRHRIEGYGFVRIPNKTGYHQITVDTWRPRHSLESEIHSYFLGGSVRILRLEELIRTAYIDTNG